jgi:hypothetical protein
MRVSPEKLVVVAGEDVLARQNPLRVAETLMRADENLMSGSVDLQRKEKRQHTSGKKGFHSSLLVSNQFDPRLKGSSVPVHLKMWARRH